MGRFAGGFGTQAVWYCAPWSAEPALIARNSSSQGRPLTPETHKATSLWKNLNNLSMPQIRAFHMAWFAFFLCFFAWFGIAPLMKVVRDELQLTQAQIGWGIIASVAITVLARLVFGWLCDRIGPRLAYTWLLIVGSIPVMLIGLAHDPWTFIVFRLLIGVIGASFVITQYHTSVMFAPNVVGTANATSAGWGNLGGGVTQFVMPLVFTLFVSGMGIGAAWGWRMAMFAAGVVCLLTGIAYGFLTQDTPEGNFADLRAAGKMPDTRKTKGSFLAACRDHRVWALFVIYGGCFGIELTINNVAALYFLDYFAYFRGMDPVAALKTAGLIAGLFGLMNIFARTLGGVFGDAFGSKWGLKGRVTWLFMALFCQGLALMLFSQMAVLVLAIPALILFSLFVQMSEGATFSVVPFVNKKALGAVSGIVGAGGNAGAVAAGFLFQGAIPWPTALLILGGVVTACSFCAFAVNFSTEAETEARKEFAHALAERRQSKEVPELQAA
jgi:NNP family nitrate/nitrite transporter-like MFS transporter